MILRQETDAKPNEILIDKFGDMARLHFSFDAEEAEDGFISSYLTAEVPWQDELEELILADYATWLGWALANRKPIVVTEADRIVALEAVINDLLGL